LPKENQVLNFKQAFYVFGFSFLGRRLGNAGSSFSGLPGKSQ
jgi:hypothetical protein